MKRLLSSLLLAAFASLAIAQSAIIRTETAPGTYSTVKSRNSASVTFLPSAVYAATQTSANITNTDYNGITVFCNVTVVPGVDTIQVQIQEIDPLSTQVNTIAQHTATASTGLIVVRTAPGITVQGPSASLRIQNDILSGLFRVRVVHSAATNFTYSCTYQLHN